MHIQKNPSGKFCSDYQNMLRLQAKINEYRLQHAEAEQIFRTVLETRRSVNPLHISFDIGAWAVFIFQVPQATVAESLIDVADMLLLQEKFEHAELLYKQALALVAEVMLVIM